MGANKTTKQADLIKMLNPVIRGWANYHRHAASSETFDKVEHEIWRKLWQWSRRRHPNKGKRWIKDKYFPREGTRKWVFAASERDKGTDGCAQAATRVGRTKIVRYVQIRAEANPFDPNWEPYFEQRALSKLLQGAGGRRTELRMLKKQGGRCPICRQMLGESYHMHRIVWRVFGGDGTRHSQPDPGARNLSQADTQPR